MFRLKRIISHTFFDLLGFDMTWNTSPIGRRPLRMAALLAVAALSACGGGDNNAGSGPATYPVDAVITALFTTDNQALSSAFVDPGTRDSYEFTTHYQPQGAAEVFEGSARKVSVVRTTLQRNGVTVQDSSSRIYFSTGPLVWYGQVADSGTYSVHAAPTANLPERASAGASGTWFTGTDYTSAAKTSVKQRSQVRWRVSPSDTVDAAWICLDFQLSDAANTAVVSGGSSCLKADSSGKILAATAAATAADPGAAR